MNTKTSGLAAIHAAALGTTSALPSADALAAAAVVSAAVASAAPAAAAEPAPKMIGMPQAEYEGNLAASNADGRKAGVTAERARIKAIVAAPEAKGREALAQSIAFDTDLAPEQALAMLKSAPEAARASRLDGLVPQPKLSTDEPVAESDAVKAGLAGAVNRMVAKRFPQRASS